MGLFFFGLLAFHTGACPSPQRRYCFVGPKITMLPTRSRSASMPEFRLRGYLEPLDANMIDRLVPFTPTPDRRYYCRGRTKEEQIQARQENVMLAFWGLFVCALSSPLNPTLASIVGGGFAINRYIRPYADSFMNARALRSGTADVWGWDFLLGEGDTMGALFSGEVVDWRVSDDMRLLLLHVEDGEGHVLKIRAPFHEAHRELVPGMHSHTIVFDKTGSKFSAVGASTDVFIPELDLWIGQYPYLDRKLFRRFVKATQ